MILTFDFGFTIAGLDIEQQYFVIILYIIYILVCASTFFKDFFLYRVSATKTYLYSTLRTGFYI